MIVDASVAIKWLVPEDDSDEADKLLDRGGLSAPDLIVCELSNAVWKKWGKGELTAVPPGLGSMVDFFDSLAPMSGLMVRAAELALELDHAAYDCFYLAQAETDRDILVTADVKLLTKLAGTPYAGLALRLRDATVL
jgi:predicted nucleic acid-binding protein